jgi:hypothetical protein
MLANKLSPAVWSLRTIHADHANQPIAPAGATTQPGSPAAWNCPCAGGPSEHEPGAGRHGERGPYPAHCRGQLQGSHRLTSRACAPPYVVVRSICWCKHAVVRPICRCKLVSVPWLTFPRRFPRGLHCSLWSSAVLQAPGCGGSCCASGAGAERMSCVQTALVMYQLDPNPFPRRRSRRGPPRTTDPARSRF